MALRHSSVKLGRLTLTLGYCMYVAVAGRRMSYNLYACTYNVCPYVPHPPHHSTAQTKHAAGYLSSTEAGPGAGAGRVGGAVSYCTPPRATSYDAVGVVGVVRRRGREGMDEGRCE